MAAIGQTMSNTLAYDAEREIKSMAQEIIAAAQERGYDQAIRDAGRGAAFYYPNTKAEGQHKMIKAYAKKGRELTMQEARDSARRSDETAALMPPGVKALMDALMDYAQGEANRWDKGVVERA